MLATQERLQRFVCMCVTYPPHTHELIKYVVSWVSVRQHKHRGHWESSSRGLEVRDTCRTPSLCGSQGRGGHLSDPRCWESTIKHELLQLCVCVNEISFVLESFFLIISRENP